MMYDPDKHISAATLRSMGMRLGPAIPDDAWTDRKALQDAMCSNREFGGHVEFVTPARVNVKFWYVAHEERT